MIMGCTVPNTKPSNTEHKPMAPRAGHEGVSAKQQGGAHHGPGDDLVLFDMARNEGQTHPDERCRNGKRAQDGAHHRGTETPLVPQHRHHKGVHIPARRQQPVDPQQAPHHGLGQQIQGAAGGRVVQRFGACSSLAKRTQNQVPSGSKAMNKKAH